MNISNGSQKGGVNVWPEKTYTQHEVDDLLEKKGGDLPSQITQIEAEAQLADRNKRLSNSVVAGLVKKSNRILVSISSVFPFDIFPDTINIEEGRLTVIRRNFFLSSRVHSVDIKDISNIFVNLAPFFAQLIIVSRTFEDNEVRIKFLRKDEAILVRRIVEGLRIFESKQIDTSGFTRETLIAKLKELSTTPIET